MIRAALVAAVFATVCFSGCERSSGTAYEWRLPPGFPAPVVPRDNRLTVEKIELGRHLFHDKRLSANGTQSCASCHRQEFAFADETGIAVGSTGERHRRNSMSLTNVAYNATYTWAHAGITTLEQHILIPLFGDTPVEMGAAGHESAILNAIAADAAYRELFAAAFPYRTERVSFDNIAKAIASYVRSLTSFNSPFDRYAYFGDDDALTASQIRGMNLFMSERLECAHCHGGINFSQFATHESTQLKDISFHATGAGLEVDPSRPEDFGLFHATGNEADKGRFKAPTLRNIARTAPYMHDGSLRTLQEVLDFYAQGGRARAGKSPLLKGFALTPEERQDVIDFLHSLTDEALLNDPRFGPPKSGK